MHYDKTVYKGKDESAFQFTFSKIRNIYAYYIVALLLLMILNVFQAENLSPLAIIKSFVNLLFQFKWEIFMLQMSEIGEKLYMNFPAWYISVMLICTHFTYALIKKDKSYFLNFIAPLIIIVGGGYLANKWNCIGIWHDYNGILCYAWIRGMIGVCVGCLTYEFYKKLMLQKESLTRSGIAMLTICEMFFIVRTVYAILIHKNGRNDFFDIFVFAALILISFSRITFIDKMLDNFISAILGQLSLAVYLNQVLLFTLLFKFIGTKYNFTVSLTLALIILIVGSAFIKVIIDILLNKWKIKREKL